MKTSQLQTGALLAGGLVIALVVHFWPADETPQTAVPVEASTAQATESTSLEMPSTAPEGPSNSIEPSVSLTPSFAPSPSVSPSAATSAPTAESTPSVKNTPEEIDPEVSGLRVSQNSRRSVTVRWDPSDGVGRYAVLSNGGVVGYTTDNMAIIIWETEAVRIGVAAETSNGLGPVTSISAERPPAPAPDPTTQAPTSTAPATVEPAPSETTATEETRPPETPSPDPAQSEPDRGGPPPEPPGNPSD